MIMHLNIPPKLLHNHCFQFLLGITVVPREIKDNTYAKFKVYKKIVNLEEFSKDFNAQRISRDLQWVV